MKKQLTDTLANRAELSVYGKAVIGIVSGIVLTVIGISRCKHDKVINKEMSTPEYWVKSHVLNPAVSARNDGRLFEHYASLGIDSLRAAAINNYIYERANHGKLITTLNKIEIDSLNRLLKVGVDTLWTFHIDNLEGEDFVLAIKDKKIFAIASYQPIDSIIYCR